MAKVVLTNPRVILGPADFSGGVDLSDHITSLSINTNFDLVEVTNVGDIAKKMVAGLEDNSVTFEFQQDFASLSVEDVIYPFRGLNLGCKVRPVNAAISATNPEYQFKCVVSQWSPLSGGVGDLATVQVQWPIYGEITKDITP